jgi:hypothetical protein
LATAGVLLAWRAAVLGLCVDPTQIGWRAEVIDGGYQSYRNLVHDVSKTP